MPRPPDYAAHDSFVAPARHRAEPWRLLLGFLLIAAVYVSLLAAFHALMAALLPVPVYRAFRGATDSGASPAGALYMLGSFAFLTIAVAVVTRQWHDRSPWTLLGPPRAALRQGSAVCVVLLILSVILWILPPSEVLNDLPPARAFLPWIGGALLALPLLLIQTSAEELVFRGYLQQQLAALNRTPLLWMAVPAVLFALLHYRPDAGDNALWIMGWAALFSVFAADLTARSGSLGPAIALHLVTNAIAILFVAQDGALSGLALYRAPIDLSDPTLVRPTILIDSAILTVNWLAARLVLRR